MRNAGPASLTLLPAEGHPAWGGLRDLAFMLGEDAAGLAGRLAPGTAAAVGDLVRGMNCYYSNLIEGHVTRPVDIERALRADFAAEPKRRDLQIEAAAHIAVQAAIDTGAISASQPPSALAAEIHRQFYNHLPDSLRWVEELGSRRLVEVIPGQWRGGDVTVGAHIAPPANELSSWMARFDECAPERFGRVERLVAIAAAHHRLLWIHPFPDDNGRVARLLSHALLRRAGVGSPLWSVARGLARNVDAYRAYLARADDPPQGALDGRGILSDGRLADFCRFFLAACIDQVRFMRTLLKPEALAGHVREFVAAEAVSNRLDARVQPLLEQAVLFGTVPRGDVPTLVGTSERQARRLVGPLVNRGLLTGAKDAPLRIAFPLGESERLFPHLWVPAGVAMTLDLPPEVDQALRSPRAAWRLPRCSGAQKGVAPQLARHARAIERAARGSARLRCRRVKNTAPLTRPARRGALGGVGTRGVPAIRRALAARRRTKGWNTAGEGPPMRRPDPAPSAQGPDRPVPATVRLRSSWVSDAFRGRAWQTIRQALR